MEVSSSVADSQNGAVIAVKDLTRTYLLGDVEVRALRGVSFDLRAGALLTVMGPSGSGKSTLMNLLGCLDTPDSGSYLLEGEDVGRLNDDQLARIRSQRIGFVFQTFNLLARTSARANCELPMLYAGVPIDERHERAERALEMVGLADRMDHHPNELSGGQQQRVAIARALVNDPAIILADEPTGNLDSKSGIEVIRILQGLNRNEGITVLLVSHDPFIARHTDRIIRLQDGRIVADERVPHPLVAGESQRPSELDLEEEVA
ncbi:MAG: ABC transporter ATP-binding protein [Chloroflexi bacterium]|nr:ABC transporter ATP-binding protein [Chloroflexota bacterium]MCH8093355.1 ABC transporter ATP-binding protein [Chloroflexota bacterium]MCH8339239.1 ABC transporter ATP-binding protein [Chloroflexota bacterium]MCH8341693.1 ABC transporter ATP-binding protein [Chloroflexota bacterium]MCH8875671.1 ABC transporter ATP-binding protein [Chloroflexota bacterium]